MDSSSGPLTVETELVTPSKRMSSVIWNYFGIETKDGRSTENESATCRSCRHHVSAKSSNTSNLLAHLKTSHTSLYAECHAAMAAKLQPRARECSHPGSSTASTTYATTDIPTQQTVKETFIKSQPYYKKRKRWNELTNAVTYCITKDSLAINTVKRTGFKKMMKAFDSRYELPSRNYFSRTALPALYNST